ncbi:uncharacterized protein BYT42DRAFT_615499 [Radiomyces spectabilis]|uniref:uncharacterized protein n=1 Tax=Radiomyces spectabilis TaxID=64574 RepID=UPI00221FFAF9|nr:uncharacterized protein BYT42DRAFT_615499 [Radiomyces spectabilis]KAI8374325.1 hypothetical protein BYT42DRAFT_615499 [Radiomyces spectabilis]
MTYPSRTKKSSTPPSSETAVHLLSAYEQHILKTVKRRAWYLDKGCQCCCISVGLDGIIGLVPVVGDAITALLALHLIRVAARVSLPNHLILRMVLNVLVDFMIGCVPILGDILDFAFKCNWRNAQLLEDYLMTRQQHEPPTYNTAYRIPGPCPEPIIAKPKQVKDTCHILPFQVPTLPSESISSNAPHTSTINMDPPSFKPTHTPRKTHVREYGTFISWID